MPFELSLLTLNCWAMPPPVYCKQRDERIRAIAEYLADESAKADVVSLQEVWLEKDYERIKQRCVDRYPYAHRFIGGVVGSGVVILSKYRFLDLTTHRFSVNGYAHHVTRGDWYGGKVIGLARIYVPPLGKSINVYVSHVHAEYNRLRDIYLAHRVVQAVEIAQWIRNSARRDEFAILMGDLNYEPEDIGYKIVTQVGNMNDSWLGVPHNDGDPGHTCNRPDNVYADKYDRRPKRIDYILFKSVKGFSVKVAECDTRMGRLPSNPNVNFSDHHAVYAKLNITADVNQDAHITAEHLNAARDTLREARLSILDGVKSSRSNRSFFFIFSGGLLLSFLLLLCIVNACPGETLVVTSLVATFFIALIFGFSLWHGCIILKTEENALLEAVEEIDVLLTQGEQLI